MPETPPIIVAAFSVGIRDPKTAKSRLVPLSAPASYTKPETIERWLQKASEDIEVQLPWYVATGDIVEAAAFDVSSKGSFFHTRAGPGKAAAEFWQWLSTYSWSPLPRHADTASPLLFAFDAKDMVKLVGSNAVRQDCEVPAGFWHGNSNCFDPVDMLLDSAAARSTFRAVKLFAEAPGEPISVSDDYDFHASVLEDLRLTAELLIRYGLCPRRILPAHMTRLRTSEAD